MRTIDADAIDKRLEDLIDSLIKMFENSRFQFMRNDVAAQITTAYEIRRQIMSFPTIDAEPVRHEGTTTFIDTDDIDKFQARIILTENKKSKFCRVFYEDDMVYGHWTEDGCCSECGEMGLYNGNEEIVRSRYCPHCGAKMDLKEENI